jgi:hypothetical protein
MLVGDPAAIDHTLVAMIDAAPPAGACAGAARIGAIEIAGGKVDLYSSALDCVSAQTHALAAETIAAAARHVLATAREGSHPFIAACLALVPELLRIAADEDWCLALEQRERMRCLLRYLIESNDRSPDAEPAIGMLDDAILIHRFHSDFAVELADYADFDAFRASEAALRGIEADACHVSRRDWLGLRLVQARRARRAAQARWQPAPKTQGLFRVH